MYAYVLAFQNTDSLVYAIESVTTFNAYRYIIIFRNTESKSIANFADISSLLLKL